jgi:anaerobic dimethyl sulfoxide reductase subunit B (iron-sulfur subunit)
MRGQRYTSGAKGQVVMEQWGFYFDQGRCIGCHACSLACKAWNQERWSDHGGNYDGGLERDLHSHEQVGRMYHEQVGWMYHEQVGRMYHEQGPARGHFSGNTSYTMQENWRRVTSLVEGDNPDNLRIINLSLSCNHCGVPACMAACPTGHLSREKRFGIVMVDAGKRCVACGLCQKACPWDAIHAPMAERHGGMSKCDLCYERIVDGLKPACVAACVTRALDAGPLAELRQKYPGARKRIPGFDPGQLEPNIIFGSRFGEAGLE